MTRRSFNWLTLVFFVLALSALPLTNGRSSVSPGLLTGVTWGASSDLSTLKSLGYDFDIRTVNPNDPASWAAALDAAQAQGLKLIIGGYPEPYSYANGQWTISPAGVQLLNYLQSRSSLVLALFVYNEPYWVNPFTAQNDPCGALSADQLRALRTKIRTVWPDAKIYQDIGEPSQWAPGGSLDQSYPCIGQKYADATGVADYVGAWYYPFRSNGYQKTQGLAALSRESSYIVNSMGAVPVWLNQAHACCGNLVWPTNAQILDWNCSTRSALPAGSLISWYVWRQSIYSDYLANHPEQWSLTTAAACATPTLTTQSPSPPSPMTVESSILDGATLSGSVDWTATVAGGTSSAVDFLIDGQLKWTAQQSPYVFNGVGSKLDTILLSDGSHKLSVVATGSAGGTATQDVSVTVTNVTATPPPPSSPAFVMTIAWYSTRSVTARWARTAAATGWRLYKDGVFVSTAGATATTARFGALTQKPHTFAVEAIGASAADSMSVVPRWVEMQP